VPQSARMSSSCARAGDVRAVTHGTR
jgi:hypothetical protein